MTPSLDHMIDFFFYFRHVFDLYPTDLVKEDICWGTSNLSYMDQRFGESEILRLAWLAWGMQNSWKCGLGWFLELG